MGLVERELINCCWRDIGSKSQQRVYTRGLDYLAHRGRGVRTPGHCWRRVGDSLVRDASGQVRSIAEVVIHAVGVAALVRNVHTVIDVIQEPTLGVVR